MNQAKSNGPSKATLIDTTKCIGCRSCQVSCKQWNQLSAEKTSFPTDGVGLQNPRRLSAKTFTVVTFHEIADAKAPGGLKYVAAKRQCMHCVDPACLSACPVTALARTKDGAVVYDDAICLGCRYCMWACPFGVPTAEWDSLAPKIRKCTLCHDRVQPPPEERNGQQLSDEDRQRFAAAHAIPACVKQCPAGALKFGDREELLAEARQRIETTPGKYVNHIYGEKEAGGTAMLYLASVPFAQLGMPDVGTKSYPGPSVAALSSVPPAVIGMGALLGGVFALQQRKAEVAKKEKPADHHDHHVEFAPIHKNLWTPANMLLAALMAFGGLSFILRFALGLGGSTNLSDTYAWGLWIVFDLVWIAVAAGAFATAGLIYAFHRKDLYSMGRSAVLVGLLSYSFVCVTLLADLGLPWHFWQLGVQAPKHSAMFEVSWCVGLYVTILAFEFMPVPFERWGLKGFMELWRKYSSAYVVVAVTLFVYLMSREASYTGVTFAVFAFMAFAFRQRAGEKPVPIMLAIAAVTLSTMHQSSLGSLFLLMPDKLDALWWSPILPLYFFLSSIAAGMALMVLVEMWIAKAHNRPLRIQQLAAMGKVVFGALLVYEVVRVGDVVVRGQLGNAFGGPKSGLFLAEILLGGVLPLLLPHSYAPSIIEWGVSIGLIAATIFLFGWAARLMPVLPKEGGASPIDAAVRRDQAVLVPVPRWESYAEDHARGIPLLRSTACGLDVSAAATAALSGLVDRVAGAVLPEKLARACREIRDRFQRFPKERALAIEWIASGVAAEPTLEHPGLLRFLGWTALSHVLAPVVEGFTLWPDSDHWGREYCPTCGSLPVMAQLVPTDTGRQRLLFCVCCKTRWKYERIGCPYCGNEASDGLGVLHVEGEDALRIDVCEECKGYVKTYANQGEEALFLADWTTLHLDVLARERGFQRMGASLYEL